METTIGTSSVTMSLTVVTLSDTLWAVPLIVPSLLNCSSQRLCSSVFPSEPLVCTPGHVSAKRTTNPGPPCDSERVFEASPAETGSTTGGMLTFRLTLTVLPVAWGRGTPIPSSLVQPQSTSSAK
ncbi:hypothetical protein H8S77_05335 [Parabacteroides sp. BX2]|uniref:Secreted protein n=1 Tax=Parabacteroides segnis TaxID=2763058 RepID=A0ABR7DXR9_9BACT|nr:MULTISPECIES: hypothetical protein [Parabacteroides]MBC5642305.1 hypothetical protein [Parabacteroides segnis]